MSNQFFLGTISELQQNCELLIRTNGGIPNGLGSENWGMSLEGEPEFLPRETTVAGIYALPVPEDKDGRNAWNGCSAECLLVDVTWARTNNSDFQFKEE